MTELTPLEVFNTVFASYIVGDHRTAISLTHSEGVYRFPGDPAMIPWAGTYVGRDLKRWFDCVKDHLDLFYTAVSEVHVIGNRVFFEAKEHWRVRATGKDFVQAIAGFCAIEQGLVMSYREYADTAPIEAALRS